MPYKDNSMDVIIFFEEIYYLPSAEKFISEYRRVLRNGGKVLIGEVRARKLIRVQQGIRFWRKSYMIKRRVRN